MTPERKLYEARNNIPSALIAIEKQCHDAGLHATAKKINESIQRIGWEIAEKLLKLENHNDTRKR